MALCNQLGFAVSEDRDGARGGEWGVGSGGSGGGLNWCASDAGECHIEYRAELNVYCADDTM